MYDPLRRDMGAGSAGRWVARVLLLTILVGFFVVRYAIRQFYRKELTWHAGEH
ncbi:MAG TPA: hypothetical protein VNP92_32265 [Actinophytocola sp.]|nr:hypothetical protein [Actinophytocola sp.]